MSTSLERRRVYGAGVSAALLCAVIGAAAVPGASPAAGAAAGVSVERTDLRVPDLDWMPCGGDVVGFECATAAVPLDYDEPAGPTTDVALAKLPASDAAHRIGTVFVNPGGPGGSGVGVVINGFGEALAANLDGRFDVIGFDPRGVGASDPLRCFDSVEDLGAFFEGVPLFPYTGGQYRPFFDRYRSLGPECLDDGDDRRIARHMSTADVARDLDLLRRAVGDRKLSYLGFSYGSYLGNTYANLFPGKVRALVIDGVLNPRLWASGDQVRSDRIATAEVFDEFLRLCAAARSQCAFWTPSGTAARWDALARSLRREPAVVPVDGGSFTYSYDFLIADTAGAMYAPEIWAGEFGLAALLDMLADIVLDGAGTADAVVEVRAVFLERLTPAQEEADYDNGFDAYFGNQCADTQYPQSFQDYLHIGAYAGAGSRWGPYWWWLNAGCADWPVAPDRYTGPWTAATSAPVLVVGNYFDPATDYAGAVASSRLLPNSRLLSYAGWGHTAYGRSACTMEYVDAYLLEGTLPPPRTVCPANPNPFLSAAQERTAATKPLVGLPPAIGPGRG